MERVISKPVLRALPGVALAMLGVILIHSIEDPLRPMAHLPPDLAWPRAVRCMLGFLVMTVAWVWLARQALAASGPTLRQLMVLAMPLHLLAIRLPPFLTSDLQYYIGIGRALAQGQSVFEQVHAVYVQGLGEDIRGHTSKYFPGFHVICLALDWLGGGSLIRTIRVHQVSAAVVMFATAALAAVATHKASVDGALGAPFERLLGKLQGEERAKRAGAAAVAIVLFSPLAVIEGTGNAHNDAYLALSLALFAVAVTTRRTTLAIFALAFGLSIKASGLLPLAVFVGVLVIAPLERRLGSRDRAALFVAVAVAAGLAAWLIVPALAPYTRVFDHDRVPCTYRSLECPVQWWLTDSGRLAARWAFSLAVRGAGGLFLLYAISRSCRHRRPIGWVAVATFVFWVYFAGQSWFWYLLSVVPLIPFVPRPWFRGIIVGIVTYPLAYGPLIIFGSFDRPSRGWQMACELAATTLAPTAILVWDRLRELRTEREVIDASER